MAVRTGGNAPATTNLSRTVHVVTWNIQFGIGADIAADALRRHDALRGADLVLLQEMDEVGTALIAERVGLNYVFAAASTHPKSGREFGNAVLSPWPLTEAVVVNLPHKSSIQGQPRIVVRAIAAVGPHLIDTCSVHTEVPSLSSGKRLEQISTIAAATEAWRSDKLVIGGDFNTVTLRGIRSVADRLAVIGTIRATTDAGTTLRRGGREFTLDHVFARGLRPVESGVVAGLAVSDHRPLWSRFDPDVDELDRVDS